MENHVINGLFTDLSIIKGVGEQSYNKYCRLLGKERVRIIDLLWHFPNKLVQRNNITKIRDLKDGEIQTVCGKIEKHKKGFRSAPHQFDIYDGTGILNLIYFKLPFYMESKLKVGDTKYISGKVKKIGSKKQIAHPDLILSYDEFSTQREFEPLYSLTAGLSNKQIIQTIDNIFQFIDRMDPFIDWHSESFLCENGWKGIIETFRDIHIPNKDYFNATNAENPTKRLAYDEVLINQIKIEHIRRLRMKSNGIVMSSENPIIDKLKSALPFKLSESQNMAISQIYADMSKPNQMIRLLQGDVGSGKTLVSFFSGLKCISSGYQFALMSPTEILAKQHYVNFKKFTLGSNIKCCLLTSSTTADDRKVILEKIRNGTAHAIIGTHSLFQENITYSSLGLVVIDEQHRFGLHQRLSLQRKSVAGKADLLLMTATPIPRTLIQIKYGDIDLSELKNLPNKKEIKTTIISISKVKPMIDKLNHICNSKNKVFWVCPQIQSNENNMSVNDRYDFLKQNMKHNISIVHGKMTEKDRDIQMNDFLEDRTNILVATSVIEVGIDIKAANIIVIENANNFGLSQIHQLRGRVGRNDQESWCILLHDNTLNEVSKNRLKIIRESSDGYQIAKEDMLIRGYGDIFGYRQSGFRDFKALNETLISEIGKKAEDDSKRILNGILNNVEQKSRYKRLFDFYEAHEYKYIIS